MSAAREVPYALTYPALVNKGLSENDAAQVSDFARRLLAEGRDEDVKEYAESLIPPKTVRVRIAVAVDVNGEWNASGWSEWDDGDGIVNASDDELKESAGGPMTNAVVRFVEADIPLPLAPQTIHGSVTASTEED